MRNSKLKSKRNLATSSKPLLPDVFTALVKEAEKGPFSTSENLVEEGKIKWEKIYKDKTLYTSSNQEISAKEFKSLIEKAEKGPFYTHTELIDKFNTWKKSLKK